MAAPLQPPEVVLPMVLTLRRPLLSSSGDIAGFEFRIDPEMQRELMADGDPASQAAQVAAVLVAARLVALEGRLGFARLPAAWLVHAAVPKTEPRTLIGLEFDPAQPLAPGTLQAVVEVARQFRAAGAQLAWDAEADIGMAPDYLLARHAVRPLAEVLAATGVVPGAESHPPVIATDLVQLEQLELAVLGGVHFATGDMNIVAPRSRATRRLPPEAGRLTQLLGQLNAGVDTAVIVDDIKGDIGVSFRLLQRMNSPAFAHLGGVASIDQAVLMLGRNELQRWLGLMLMQFAPRRRLASALQEIALWRARTVELLAVERGEREPGRFFMLGLASMLGGILETETAEVVQALGLPEEAESALVEQAGPWHVFLRAAIQVESRALTDADAVSDGFVSAERVQLLSNQAWAWAAANALRESGAGNEKSR
ncbi:hypothetical protein RD110_17880 [Rhodoferax koreense]|uniref:HDOD domain-containing protein n=1 Tax=Rhodoferax koreensis TaxID=1842727 RepID=A0A1P8JYL4_9BURK|nr:HDOD domain-containing protein [Rhodoferax koreense]APW38846.1 hypothetical protein RD110_17880 [Rhodoferax koreense]